MKPRRKTPADVQLIPSSATGYTVRFRGVNIGIVERNRRGTWNARNDTRGWFSEERTRKAAINGLVELATRSGLAGIPPKRWWIRKSPKKERNCYKSKADALKVFLDYNAEFIDQYANGPTYRHGCSEFDSINHTYDVPRRRCVRTVADAVWYALRGRGPQGGSPFCIRDINLRALNDTTAGRQGGGFRLPPHVEEEIVDEAQENYWKNIAYQAGRSDCFITWRRNHGYFVSERYPRKGTRQLQCVCRDRRGRFAKCEMPPEAEEVPF